MPVIPSIINGGLTLIGPSADGSANQALITDGSLNTSFATVLLNLVEDTTPQLGGDLDGQSTYDLNNIVNVDVEGYADFTEIAVPASPGAGIVRVFGEDDGGFTTLHVVDESGVDLDLTRDSVVVVRNTTGSTITKGSVVYTSGSSGTLPQIALADASSAATMPSLGIVVADIANNSNGQIMQAGLLGGLDTSSWTDGDRLYVSATAGTLTSTEPTGTDVDQIVATVVKGGSVGAGILFVNIGSANDPGLTQTLTNKTIDTANNTLTLAASDVASGTFADARISESSVTQHQAALAITESQISDLSHDAVSLQGVNLDATVGTPNDGDILVYRSAGSDWVLETKPAGGGGSAVILDLGDDGTNESTDLSEIAVTGDTNSIFTEPSADKLLIAVGQNWPGADIADALNTDALDSINEIASSLKSGLDTTLITGTAGTNGNLIQWNTDGDAVDASIATSAVVTLTGSQTLTNKTIDGDNNTISNLAHGSEVDNPSSGVHGVTGSVVGTSDTQTLTNKTLTAPTFDTEAVFDAEVDNGSSGASATIDWTSGPKQAITLSDDATLSFTAPSGPCNLILRLVQDGTGSRNPSWPAAVKWAGGAEPTWSTSASAEDIVAFYYNGTSYYGAANIGFA